VTPEQIDTLSLPTAPRKAPNLRSFEGDTVQAEAIPPDVQVQMVTTTATDRFDRAAYTTVLARKTCICAELADTLRRLLR
jgi:hypothetical protein